MKNNSFSKLMDFNLASKNKKHMKVLDFNNKKEKPFQSETMLFKIL